MSLSLIEFRELTFFLFLVYLFIEVRIYLALWAGLFYVSKAIIHLYRVSIPTYKTIIVCYALILLVGYLYKFRNVVRGKQVIENVKLRNISSDKKKINRMGIASLLLLVVNIVAIIAID